MKFNKKKKIALLQFVTIPLIALPIVANLSCVNNSNTITNEDRNSNHYFVTKLEQEVQRLNNLSNSFKVNNLKINPNKVNDIDEAFIIKNYTNKLNLNHNDFDYQVAITTRSFNKIKFYLNVKNKNNDEFRTISNEFVLTFSSSENNYSTIDSVSISNWRESYLNGQTIFLKPNINIPNNEPLPFTCEWIMDGNVVSSDKNFIFIAKQSDNGKSIKLKVKFGGNKFVESSPHILNINISHAQALKEEIQRIQDPKLEANIFSKDILIKFDSLTTFDSSTGSYQELFNRIKQNLMPNIDQFTYRISKIKKGYSINPIYNQKQAWIIFNLEVKNKGCPKCNFEIIDKVFCLYYSPRIEKIEIDGFKNEYFWYENYNLKPRVTMSNGAIFDESNLQGIRASWLIDGQVVGEGWNFNKNVIISNNGKKLKLVLNVHGKIIESVEYPINVCSIRSIGIDGLLPEYWWDDSFNLTPTLTLTNGNNIQNATDIVFEWIIDGIATPSWKFNRNVNISDNGKRIKLRVKYDSEKTQVIESEEHIINVIHISSIDIEGVKKIYRYRENVLATPKIILSNGNILDESKRDKIYIEWDSDVLHGHIIRDLWQAQYRLRWFDKFRWHSISLSISYRGEERLQRDFRTYKHFRVW